MEEKNTKLNNTVKELSDDELNNVTGGSNFTLHFFDKEEDVRFIFFPGDTVYVKESFFHTTKRCVVVRYETFYDPQYNCYEDLYIVRGPDNLLRKILRDDVVNKAD